ncbi:LysR family transcriptional regulator [Phreatobacter stygius]|uniref:LysR family transcriptional regulator n=1 Tax=Phreatobacter stygius TaxID=1940610 RepID=UPI001476ECC7|nr:LysR family transcriptional regulator [Phreatobacter stygius]
MQDLNDLYLFAAVVQHKGFSPAGRALDIPKSKLSKHVARLEQRLGVRLIERSTRRFRVTDIGQEFYQQCQSVLAGVEVAEALVAKARAEPRGIVRLACPPDIAQSLMARILPAFLKRFAEVKVQMLVANRPVDLIEERVDVALRVRTRLDTDPNLTMRILGQSRQVLVASPDFIARHGGHIGVETLGLVPTLSSTEQFVQDTWHLTDPDGRKVEVAHEPRLSGSSFAMLKQAAIEGLGVALLPEQVADDAIDAGALVLVLPGWTAPMGTIHLVFTTRQGLLPAVRALIDHIVKEYPRMMKECTEALRAVP